MQKAAIGTRIYQGLLAIIFTGFGVLHLVAPPPIRENMVALGIEGMLPIVGTVEIIGGVALFAALFVPRLTGLAALWCVAIMAGAVLSHLRVGDFAGSVPASFILILPLVLVFLRRQDLTAFFRSPQATAT